MATLDEVIWMQKRILDMQADANRLLADALRREPTQRITPRFDNIRDVVCHVTGVSPEHLHAKKRSAHIANARHAFCYLARELYQGQFSYPTIARYLERDHTSVMSSERRARQLMRSNAAFRADVERMIAIAAEQRPALVKTEPPPAPEAEQKAG